MENIIQTLVDTLSLKKFSNINELTDFVYKYLKSQSVINVPPKNSVKFKLFVNKLDKQFNFVNSGDESTSYDDIWDRLKKLGYSEGDDVLLDDLYKCLGDFPFEAEIDLPALEEEFSINFVNSGDESKLNQY